MKKKPVDKKLSEKKSSGLLRTVPPKQPGTPGKRPAKSPNPFVALFVVALVVSLFYAFFSGSPKEEINDKAALSDVVANYHSGAYSEIVIEGSNLLAKRPEKEKIVGETVVKYVEVDKILLPPNDGLVDLGFNDKTVATKVTVKDDSVSQAFIELVPTLILGALLLGAVFILFSRMGGG